MSVAYLCATDQVPPKDGLLRRVSEFRVEAEAFYVTHGTLRQVCEEIANQVGEPVPRWVVVDWYATLESLRSAYPMAMVDDLLYAFEV